MAFLPFAGRFLLPSDQHINMALEWALVALGSDQINLLKIRAIIVQCSLVLGLRITFLLSKK